MAIPIPAPLPSDSDKVVNLLQNAALFGRIGDTEEALHWLRQAAECAGDSGDDARTLVLARSAAELNLFLEPAADTGSNGRSGVHERRLPAPPPRARDEAAFLLKRTAPPSKPPAKALDPAEVEALDPAEVKALEPTPSEDAAADSKPPDSRSTLTPPPLPSGRANGSRPPPASTRPLRTSSRPAPPSMRSRTAAPPASRPSPVSTRAPAAVSRASIAPATRSYKPAAPPAAAAVVLPSLRQAARVSVERSLTEPGLFLVRLLDEGDAPKSGCTEALLVSLDPNAHPFAV